MGQKVNPYGFRLGIVTDWKSRWFADREYTDYLTEDVEDPQVPRRPAAPGRGQPCRDRAHPRPPPDRRPHRPAGHRHRPPRASRPTASRQGLSKISGNPKIQLNIQEIKQPELDADLIAQGVADQLDRPGLASAGP